MQTHAILLRGINVGGKSKVPMAELRANLEKAGFSNVSTYINSGNVILESDKSAVDIKKTIDKLMVDAFGLDKNTNKVLVLSRDQLQRVIDAKPKGFGETPKDYYSDVIFLMNIEVEEAIKVFSLREGVDVVWPGEAVIYSQRLGELRTKSRLSKIVGTKEYKSMTIRTYGTIIKLLALADHHE